VSTDDRNTRRSNEKPGRSTPAPQGPARGATPRGGASSEAPTTGPDLHAHARAFFLRLRAQCAWFQEWSARPLSIPGEDTTTRHDRRAMVERLCNAMSAQFVRRERGAA